MYTHTVKLLSIISSSNKEEKRKIGVFREKYIFSQSKEARSDTAAEKAKVHDYGGDFPYDK